MLFYQNERMMNNVYMYLKIKRRNPTGFHRRSLIDSFLSFVFSREQLNKQLTDIESRTKSNRDKQKVSKDVQIDGTKQLKYWRDLLRMMELKRKLATVREKSLSQ